MMDSDIDSFDLGDSVNALAEPYGMDAWFPVQKMTTYLQEPEEKQTHFKQHSKKVVYPADGKPYKRTR